jgi:predicted PhzF superfamily epimerase YddE/YHI9
MDFPSRPGVDTPPPPGFLDGLGLEPDRLLKSRDWMAVFESEEDILGIKPDYVRLLAATSDSVIVTAPGKTVDFVSRFFAPAEGIPEDPVTGSAHCTLIPYWADRLGRSTLRAHQVSRRGGELYCSLDGDRVTIAGRAITYLIGEITV